MKKIWVMMLAVALLFCGCRANYGNTEISSCYEELSKAQEIAVIPANHSDAVDTLTESGDIEDFITALDMDRWGIKALPQMAEVSGTFSFLQEETIKFGKSRADGELHCVCKIVCYREIPYVTLKIAGLHMSFQISDEAAQYLTKYFLSFS